MSRPWPYPKDETPRGLLRWWTWNGRLSFACLVGSVALIGFGVHEGSVWVALANFGASLLQVNNVLRCVRAVMYYMVQCHIEEKEAVVRALEAEIRDLQQRRP